MRQNEEKSGQLFFRPGPFRRMLAQAGKNVDRAYSPRAYVVFLPENELPPDQVVTALREIPDELPWPGIPDGAAACAPVDGDIFVLMFPRVTSAAWRKQVLAAVRAAYPHAVEVRSGKRIQWEKGYLLLDAAADPIVVLPRHGHCKEMRRHIQHLALEWRAPIHHFR